MFTKENFISGLQLTFKTAEITVNENNLIIKKTFYNFDNSAPTPQTTIEIPCSEISKMESQVAANLLFNDLMLYSSTQFEVPIKSQTRSKASFAQIYDPERYRITDHQYDFILSKVSNEYIFALMCFLAVKPEITLDTPPIHFNSQSQESPISFENFCEFFHFTTMKITSPKQHTPSDFKKLTNSYLFNVSYNNNLSLSAMNLSDTKESRKRKYRRGGQLFPFKEYHPKLVNYYNQGMSTDIAFTQYLAFYHVAEFYFQSISEQEAFCEIENFITHPSFSPYRKEDIRTFYNKIKKKMRDQREDGVWDEKNGLLLCLKTHIPNLENLKSSILSIDPTGVDYYKSTNVSFSDASQTIDFDTSKENIYISIRNRVYSVRNAIVHSKDGERLKYEPFKHDKELAKEIPLIRAIAEEIIINSAVPLDITHTP